MRAPITPQSTWQRARAAFARALSSRGSKVKPIPTQRPRKLSTAVEVQYPMWLLPLHHFLGLDELLPHQELLRRGMLVQWEARMRTVIFISHQWTSFDHPDHTGRQLQTVQRMLERMVMGQVSAVDAPFEDQAALKGNVKITPGEWKSLLYDAFVWIDYAGVPQMKAGSNSATSDSR